MHSPIPHRFREASYRRYEIIINQAVEAFPNCVTFKPSDFQLASVTFACRCRDAMKSLKENQWNTFIDLAKFNTHFDTIVLSERTDGTIIIGSKESIAKTAANALIPAFHIEAPTTLSSDIILLKSKDCKDLIMLLSHRRMLSPHILLAGLTPTEVTDYQNMYDIAIEEQDNQTHILI